MREIRATKLTATAVADVIEGEVIILYAGRLGLRVLMVPASDIWRQRISAEYGATGLPLHITKETLDASAITRIVARQVDEKWNPFTYGEFIHTDKVRAFILPDNLFWREKVREDS